MSPLSPEPLQPLRGIRVIDLTRYAPGPFATLLLAALGAEVVKVEAPNGGDPLRLLDSRAFGRLNRGKKSVVLDLKSETGHERALGLASSADVLVEGFRPGVMERLGLDAATMRERQPRLVYTSITGYDTDGPYRDRAGHDVNYMAVAGALGEAHRPLPLQVADFAGGGLFAALGILSALMERRRTGRGSTLEVAMTRGVSSMMLLAGGAIEKALSGRNPNYTIYETRDGGKLSVGALEPKFWRSFCGAIERPDLVDRMLDPDARGEVDERLRQHDLEHWERVFAETDACVEAVAPPRAPAASEPVLPFGLEGAALGPAPRLGEHTDAFFRID